MSDDHFHLNRPVHLARRDVRYEQAVELIEQLPAQKTPEEELNIAENALRLFHEAKEHAQAANRSGKTPTEDQLFLEFLDAAMDNTQSVARMLRRRRSVESDACPLGRFLDSTDVSSKMSTHYRRCAAHILKGLTLILQQAARPYEQLRNSSLVKMSVTDKARYEKARAHLMEKPND